MAYLLQLCIDMIDAVGGQRVEPDNTHRQQGNTSGNEAHEPTQTSERTLRLVDRSGSKNLRIRDIAKSREEPQDGSATNGTTKLLSH